jgi:hypothetical protein
MARGTALDKHTAAPSLTGYIYQLSQALLYLLELKEGDTLGIEVIDDIHVDTITGTDLVQSKLQLTPASLTDGSRHLWNTLRIWADAIRDGSLDLSQTRRLVLLTTATTSAGTIAAALEQGESAKAVAARLLAVPKSTDVTLRPSFDSVHKLTRTTLTKLVSRVAIAACQPSPKDIGKAIGQQLVRKTFHPRTVQDAINPLRGWLEARILDASGKGITITEAEFGDTLRRIRDSLTETSLPARQFGAAIAPRDVAGQMDEQYVKQLGLVRADDEVIVRSIEHFLHASNERNEWVSKGELLPDDLTAFDKDLTDRWKPLHDMMRLKLEQQSSADHLCKAGLLHFHEVETVHVPIRQGWAYIYLTTGSYHILANRTVVGWHPDFQRRLVQTNTRRRGRARGKK